MIDLKGNSMNQFQLWCRALWCVVWPPALVRHAQAEMQRELAIRHSLRVQTEYLDQRFAEMLAKSAREAALVLYSAKNETVTDDCALESAEEEFAAACSAYLLAEAKVISTRAQRTGGFGERCGCDESLMLRDQLREHKALYDACIRWFHELAPTSSATLHEPEAASFNAELAVAVCEVIGWADV